MGCKANWTDSQTLEADLQILGGVPVGEEQSADLFLLNTCTVTDQADKEGLSYLRKSKSPLTIATGCMAQVDPEKTLQAGPHVKVVKNSAKYELQSIVNEWLSGEKQNRLEAGDRVGWHGKILGHSASLEEGQSKRTRVFYKVQDGCNAFCSYCVIPLARGRSRSLSWQKIVSDLQALEAEGALEVNLTAIHAADYSDDGLDFFRLIEAILRETKIPRIRLTSLDPLEIDQRYIDLLASEGRICSHFHVSLQSAQSDVLKAMGRNYGSERVRDCLQEIALKVPHAFVGMDVIAGFPTETESQFLEGLNLLRDLPFSKAHVFPFSPRKGTRAARLLEQGEGVPLKEIQARATALRELSESKFKLARESKLGSIMEVLIEGKRLSVPQGERLRTVSQGLSRSFFRVLVPGEVPANSLKRVKIVGLYGSDGLKGESI
jgi:threonylcarbamoyladenosine tRNA methylthiotransferase MtaB